VGAKQLSFNFEKKKSRYVNIAGQKIPRWLSDMVDEQFRRKKEQNYTSGIAHV
jgi:hypothetical protein